MIKISEDEDEEGSIMSKQWTVSSPEVPEIDPRVRQVFADIVHGFRGPWGDDDDDDDGDEEEKGAALHLSHDTIREQTGPDA